MAAVDGPFGASSAKRRFKATLAGFGARYSELTSLPADSAGQCGFGGWASSG